MKVKELIQLLKQQDPEAEIVISQYIDTRGEGSLDFSGHEQITEIKEKIIRTGSQTDPFERDVAGKVIIDLDKAYY